MTLADMHFARVFPIVGSELRQLAVAVWGVKLAAPLIEHLAASGVRRWHWRTPPSDPSHKRLRARLLQQHGAALALEAQTISPSAWEIELAYNPPELLLAVGTAHERSQVLAQAARLKRPALVIAPPTGGQPITAQYWLPGDPVATALPDLPGTIEAHNWDWVTALPMLAGLARAILLHPYHPRADLTDLWANGCRVVRFGGLHPFNLEWLPLTHATSQVLPLGRSEFASPTARHGTLLVIGLGSLGSIAAQLLAPLTQQLVLVDPDSVEIYNPVRQAFNVNDVGSSKARALGRQLQSQTHTHELAIAITEEEQIAVLCRRYPITAALVATGTHHDFAICRGLRQAGIPHVVGRCYPRARYWEAILVDRQHGATFEQIRGNLRRGPAAPPTPEQIAAYSSAGELEQEPATLIESGWTARWLARLTHQWLLPLGLRERWFLALQTAKQNYLIGGVAVEATPTGPAYAIDCPGRIWEHQSIFNS